MMMGQGMPGKETDMAVVVRQVDRGPSYKTQDRGTRGA